MKTFNRREHWTLTRAERYFLMGVLLISSGSAGTAQPVVSDQQAQAYGQPTQIIQAYNKDRQP